jgi:transposase
MRFTMKRDGRTLDHATLETIRRMAVQRVREGERASDVIASFGMHRCTIYSWLKAARGRGHGLKALAAKPASGRPRTLTVGQEHQVFRWINGKNPMQYGFDFGLWTRQIARDLIAQRFGVTLSLASVGGLLARVGLTPQKPLQRAYQRDPEAIACWQRETYPAIARQAKRDKADVYFWDESGFRADAVQGTTWGAKGQTPVVSVPGQRQGISAASAVSAKGAFWFATYAGGLNGTLFVTLLRRMMRGRRKPVNAGVKMHRRPE